MTTPSTDYDVEGTYTRRSTAAAGVLTFLMALWVGRRFSAERRAARRDATQQEAALAAAQARANTAGA